VYLLGDYGEAGPSGAPHLVLKVCTEVRTDATTQSTLFAIRLHVGNYVLLTVKGELPSVYEIPQSVGVRDLDHFRSRRITEVTVLMMWVLVRCEIFSRMPGF
jgi:hypothetical protein